MVAASNAITSADKLRELLDRYPRHFLSHLPTPLERMEHLSEQLEAINLLIKRDDQTGLALGGNKSRKLDFIIADALNKGADSFITWGGLQSNWCRQAAAAARRAGIKPILLLFKRATLPSDYDGNLLLDCILGAELKVVDWAPGDSFMRLGAISALIDEIVDSEIASGRHPYVAPIGGTLVEGSMDKPLGAISYALALVEMNDQAQAAGFRPDYIVLASGSGSTQAGLLAAARLAFPEQKIIGISVGEDVNTLTQAVSRAASETAHCLGFSGSFSADDIIVQGEFIGGGYGILDKRSAAALRIVGDAEGIVLDPVYTCKAMAGLLELAARGYFEPGSNVIFVHTGGAPALFPYREQIRELIG